MRLVHLGTATAIALAAAAPAGAQYRQAQPQYQAAPMVAPATQASVANLDNRIVALERQIADLLRVGEENAHRIGQLEAELKQQKDDSTARIAALEAQLAATARAPVQSAAETDEPKSTPMNAVASTSSKPKPTNAVVSTTETDPAEEAYDAGYQLWNAGKYDEAVGALRAFVSAYPSHRRTSWANNLIGRALLDKGEPRAAAVGFTKPIAIGRRSAPDQLPLEPEGRAGGGQPLLSRPGADEARPGEPSLQGLWRAGSRLRLLDAPRPEGNASEGQIRGQVPLSVIGDPAWSPPNFSTGFGPTSTL